MNNSSDLLILQFLHHERKVWSSLFIYNRTKCYCVHVFDLPGSQLSDIENHLLSFISCFKGWFLYLPITFFHFTKCVQHKISASTTPKFSVLKPTAKLTTYQLRFLTQIILLSWLQLDNTVPNSSREREKGRDVLRICTDFCIISILSQDSGEEFSGSKFLATSCSLLSFALTAVSIPEF